MLVNELDIALGEIWQIMGQCSTGTMDRSSSSYEVDTELMTYVVAKWELTCLAAFERINELIRCYVLDIVPEEFKTIILQTLVRYLLLEFTNLISY